MAHQTDQDANHMGKKEIWQEDFGKAPVLLLVKCVNERVFDFLNSLKALGQFEENNQAKSTRITDEIDCEHDQVCKIHEHSFFKIVFENWVYGVNLFSINHFDKNHAWKKFEDKTAKWKNLKRLNDFVFLDFLESNVSRVHKDTNDNGKDNHAGDEFFEPVIDLDSFLVEKIVGLSLIIGLKFNDLWINIVKF